jgi:DtxR family Mn-dependent transcriptional regulator
MTSHSRHEKKEKDATESVEEYLEALCRLMEKGEKLSTKKIAERLDISQASVSEMLKRLGKEGFVKHAPYSEAELTEKGRKLGGRVLGRHRLLERFLEGMGMRRNRIHGEACKLEHYVSDELECLIKKGIDVPKGRGIISLIDLKRRQEAEIVDIEGGSRVVKRLHDMGLTPGARIWVRRSAPLSGPVEVCIRDSCLVIGRGVASKVFVKVGK